MAGAERHDPFVGKVIDGRYRVGALLGEGGSGRVYRADQLRVGRAVAVKILNPSAAGNQLVVRRFEQEAKIIAQLSHPNTIKLFDCGRLSGGAFFLVTELLEGRPLSAVLEGGPIDSARTLRLVVQVCESLCEAHARGIVHRDLKPANVFVQEVGGVEVVRVLDFGLARSANDPSLTTPDQIFGTPGYMSPEQCLSARVDPSSDIYSLGAVAFECLAGERLFPVRPGESPFDYLMRTAIETPIPIRERRACRGLAPELVELVERMVAPMPEGRPRSVEVVQSEAERILAAPGDGFGFDALVTERSLDLSPPRSTDELSTVREGAGPRLTGPTALLIPDDSSGPEPRGQAEDEPAQETFIEPTRVREFSDPVLEPVEQSPLVFAQEPPALWGERASSVSGSESPLVVEATTQVPSAFGSGRGGVFGGARLLSPSRSVVERSAQEVEVVVGQKLDEASVPTEPARSSRERAFLLGLGLLLIVAVSWSLGWMIGR